MDSENEETATKRMVDFLEAATKNYGGEFPNTLLTALDESLQDLAMNMNDPPVAFKTESAKHTMLSMPCRTISAFVEKIGCVENEIAKDKLLDICHDRFTNFGNMCGAIVAEVLEKRKGGKQ